MLPAWPGDVKLTVPYSLRQFAIAAFRPAPAGKAVLRTCKAR